MAESSKIEWTDATWNPITGCTLVSEGCRHCYAATLAATRLKHHPSRAGLARRNAAGEARFTGEVRLNEQWLDQPLRWRRPRRIFVCAHGDLFHEAVPDEWIDRVFAVMALAQQHTFQVLTKRPERMRDYLGAINAEFHASPDDLNERFGEHCVQLSGDPCAAGWFEDHVNWPLPNVWLGTSVEDQATADARIPHLLATPAAVRFVSAEPLLGPVDLTAINATLGSIRPYRATVDSLDGTCQPLDHQSNDWFELPSAVDWVIVGGESGPKARPMHPDWARSLRDQCQAAGVAYFFKQWGEWICAGQQDETKIRTLPRGDEIKWLREDGLVSARPISALTPGGLDDSDGETMMIGGEYVTVFPEHEWLPVSRVGKHRAGRLLDDREWNEVPK